MLEKIHNYVEKDSKAYTCSNSSIVGTVAANSVDFFIEFKFEFEFSLSYDFEFSIFIFESSSSKKFYQVISSLEKK